MSEELRSCLRAFRSGTAASFEGIRPRQLLELCDGALETFIDILVAVD